MNAVGIRPHDVSAPKRPLYIIYRRLVTALTFDDVLIEPQYSDISSRSDIEISSNFLDCILPVPILSSPMSSITETSMAKAMWLNGGIGILHRFADIQTQGEWVNDLLVNNVPIFLSVGLKEHFPKLIEESYAINIDTAHGHRKEVTYLISLLKTLYPTKYVIAGNVATQEGFTALAKAGADAIRVGIGPGAACTTRIVTGIGVPQLTAIQECAIAQISYPNVKLIADGGIRNSGDMVKALAAGADVVILGKVLAAAIEASGLIKDYGEIVGYSGKYRMYAGQSTYGSNGDKKAPEGEVGWVNVNTNVSTILETWSHYLRSAMSYIGARNLEELRVKAKFIQVSPTSLSESNTRL